MKRVDVLCHHGTDVPFFAETLNCPMSRVRLCFQESGPSDEAARPIPLARLMVGDEFVVVDRTIGFVSPVGTLVTSII